MCKCPLTRVGTHIPNTAGMCRAGPGRSDLGGGGGQVLAASLLRALPDGWTVQILAEEASDQEARTARLEAMWALKPRSSRPGWSAVSAFVPRGQRNSCPSGVPIPLSTVLAAAGSPHPALPGTDSGGPWPSSFKHGGLPSEQKGHSSATGAGPGHGGQ